MTGTEVLDWTCGRPGIAGYRCGTCGAVFYFARDFCPSCGSLDVTQWQASGLGVVEARTLIHRAPAKDLGCYLPYAIMLVRLGEGLMIMAQGDRDLRIGDAVQADFVSFGEQPVIPFFRSVGRPVGEKS